MFKKSHFSIYEHPDFKHTEYPPFFRIVQSIHSPLLGNDKFEDSPYTTILTFGLWRNTREQYVPHVEKGISLCSKLHSKITDPIELIKRIKLMKLDYLNTKSLNDTKVDRPASELIIERKQSERGPFPLYGKIDGYTFFFPEVNGGIDINQRLTLALPLCKKLYLMQLPDSDDLRADDKYVVEMLGSFPSRESHSLAAALMQGLIYCDRRWLR